MRHVPVMLSPVPHSAGEPVVTVYEVIMDAFALSKYLQLSKKITQIGIDGQFIHRSVISGPEMNEANISIQFHSLFASRIAKACKDIDQMATPSQFLCHFSDTYTHTAGVIRPQFSYGTGVNA
jgi:hypothetical protein